MHSRTDLLAQARLLHHLDAPASQPALRGSMLAELGIYEGDAAHLAQFEADEIEADPELQRFAALLDAHLGELVDDMAAAWPETREGLIAFAQEHGRRYFEKHGKWPSHHAGSIEGCGVATWCGLQQHLSRLFNLSLPDVFNNRRDWNVSTRDEAERLAVHHQELFFHEHQRWPTQKDGPIGSLPGRTWGQLNDLLRRMDSSLPRSRGTDSGRRSKAEDLLKVVLTFFAKHGRWPVGRTDGGATRALYKLRSRKEWALLDKAGIPRVSDAAESGRIGQFRMSQSDRSARARSVHKRPQFTRLSDLIGPMCRLWRYHQRSQSTIGDDSACALQVALLNSERRPSSSRGFATAVDRSQVNSLARANDEIAADCWRLWLEGADAPDPRPWADILAAGDNKRVVKAERVAFLDWQRPGRDGKPARRPWPQAQWPDLRAEPAPQEVREAA